MLARWYRRAEDKNGGSKKNRASVFQTDRYNKGKVAEDAARARFKLVVRGNKLENEITAFTMRQVSRD